MLTVRGIFGTILLMAISCAVLAQSHQHPKAKIEDSKLGANNSPAQPAPAPTYPTIQEITEAIANGIERAANKHETENHTPPPNDSNWWFNLVLAGFTGLLVGRRRELLSDFLDIESNGNCCQSRQKIGRCYRNERSRS